MAEIINNQKKQKTMVVKAAKLTRQRCKKPPQDPLPPQDLHKTELSVLVPKKGRERGGNPVRPPTSTDKEGYDEDSGDSVSPPPISAVALTTAGTSVKSSKQKSTTTDTNLPKYSGDISEALNDIPSARHVVEVITQPHSSASSPMAQTCGLSTNLANVRKSSVPILSGAHVLELPLTPVSTSVFEDRNVIPSGRQITRTPVATPLGDDPSLEDSSLTPAMKDAMSDVSVRLKTDHMHLIKMNNNKTFEVKSRQDSNETSSAKRLEVQLHQTDCDSSPVEHLYSITAGFRSKASVDVPSPGVPVDDTMLCVENNNLVSNTLIGSPNVNKLLTRQDGSPRFIPLPIENGNKRLWGNCTISSVDSADAKDGATNNGGAKIVPCQSEVESNSMLSSAVENDITSSPSLCRDHPPLINDTLDGCSSSVDLETIILEPPHGFDSSCPSDRGEGEVNSSSDLREPLVSESCIETRRILSSVSFAEKEVSGHLAVLKCNKDKTYDLEATKNHEDRRKTFVVTKPGFGSGSKIGRTTFVLPQEMNCVSACNLNTHECKRQSFVVLPDEMASNTLFVPANESRELMPSPEMSANAFGELTLLPKNVGETFLVDQSVANTLECCTGYLALSSTEEDSSCYSIKYPRSDGEGSEEGSDAPSTPTSNRRGPGNVNYVPRGRQLYRTPVEGLSKNEVTGGAAHAGNDNSQTSEDDLHNQAIEYRNERGGEELSSASEFLSQKEVGIKTNVETLGVEKKENYMVEISVIQRDAGAMVKVPQVTIEKDLTFSSLDETHETLSNESPLKPVKFELCKNETYVKDSTVMGHGSPKLRKRVRVADERTRVPAVDVNAIKPVVPDMEDSCDLDDSGNIFKLIKSKQVKRNLPVEKRSHGAKNKGVKRSRKDSIEHLLIKQMNEDHLLSSLKSENDQTGHSVLNSKNESSPSKLKRGRKKLKGNSVTGKKKSKTPSAVSETLVKAEQTDALIATVIHSIGDPKVEIDTKEGTSSAPLTRGVGWNEKSVNFPRPSLDITTSQPTNPAPSSVLDGNAEGKEVFDELKANQNSRKVTKGEKIVSNRKVAHTYSKKTKRELSKASITKSSLSKLKKKKSRDEIIAVPQKSIEPDDLIEESPENSMRRPHRQRGTKVVDYNESPFLIPILPSTRGRRGRPAKHSQGTNKCEVSVNLDTHESLNILGPPQPFFEMLETDTTNGDNLECSNDFHHTVSANDADKACPQDISKKDCGESNGCVHFKQPTRRGLVRSRGGRNGPSAVMSATKSNAVTRGRSQKRNVLKNTINASNVPETISREANLTKTGVKFPACDLDGRAREEHKSPALREGAVTNNSKGREKKVVTSSKTRKEGIATALPGECIPEVLTPALKSRTGVSRGRVRTSAKRGRGRATPPIASKSGQLKVLDDENGDIVKEFSESDHAKENSKDKVSLSAKKVAGDRVPSHTKAVKNKRSARSVNKVTPQLSASPGLPDGPQNVNEENATAGEILPEKLSLRGKSAITEEGKEIETSTAAKTKATGIQKKRAPVVSKTKPTTKSKVLKSASAELESEFVDTDTLFPVPKRKWKDTNREKHEESLNKKIREESLNGRPGEASGTIAKKVSSRGANRPKANKTKAQSVMSHKVNFEGSAGTSSVTGPGSKSKVGTEGGPASKPRATRAHAGKAATT